MSEIANEQFRQYVTSTAFHLSLSKRMAEYIDYIARDQALADLSFDKRMMALPTPSHFYSSSQALQRRGLIERYNDPRKDGRYTEEGRGKPNATRLTAAGQLVYYMLIQAGLIQPIIAGDLLEDAA